VQAVRVAADQSALRADDFDLSYLTIELVDADGVVSTMGDRSITVTVTGAGILQGLGSARPVTTETYSCDTHTTFEGRALAVIRPTRVGAIEITVAAEALDPVTVTVTAG
jgi:beta-galactosidase